MSYTPVTRCRGRSIRLDENEASEAVYDARERGNERLCATRCEHCGDMHLYLRPEQR